MNFKIFISKSLTGLKYNNVYGTINKWLLNKVLEIHLVQSFNSQKYFYSYFKVVNEYSYLLQILLNYEICILSWFITWLLKKKYIYILYDHVMWM